MYTTKVNLNPANFSRFVVDAMRNSTKLQAELLPYALQHLTGGELLIGHNKPTVHIDAMFNTVSSVGVGNVKKAFVKSSNKGMGRVDYKELKVPDAELFIHLAVDDNEDVLVLTSYTKEEVFDLIK